MARPLPAPAKTRTMRAVPLTGTRCQEASPASRETYTACGRPAEFIVKNRDPSPYAMCAMCADHNVKNRGAYYVEVGTPEAELALWEPPAAAGVRKAMKDSPIPFDQRLSAVRQKTEELGQDLANAKRLMVGLLMAARDEENLAAAYIQTFRVARDMEDVMKDGAKPITEICNEFKLQKIPEAYEAAGISTLTLDSGDRVSLSERVLAAVKGGMMEAAIKYLRSNKKTKELVIQTINASTLSAYAKTLLEQNLELPDSLFNVTVQTAASLTRGKKK